MSLTQQQSTLRDRGICVIIPTYNNEGTIREVVEATLAECADVIVVCDGCTDSTPARAKEVEGAIVLEYDKNRGKGHALKVGFKEALRRGFAYAITLDADGQHYPSDIKKLLAANIEHPGAIIIGKRQMKNVERVKGSSFANKFANFWFWAQTWRRVTDTQSGYRLYPLKKMRLSRFMTSRYEAELELVVIATWHGVEIFETPIDIYYPDPKERVTHFRPVLDFTRISILNTVLCVLAGVYGIPLRVGRFTMNVARTLYSALFFAFFTSVVFQPWVWWRFKVRKPDEHQRHRLHRLLQWSSKFILFTHRIPGTRCTYKIADEKCFDRPAVIICNHQSHFDLVMQLHFSPNIIFLTNDWVWRNPFYGSMIHNAEFIPVREGIDEIMPKLRDLVARGYSIAIYPEGHRSKDGKISRFHQGAFHIAQELGIDILPMCLYGPGRVLRPRKHLMHRSPMYIEVGQRVTQAELQALGDPRRQASHFRKLYKEWYQRLSNKIEQHV